MIAVERDADISITVGNNDMCRLNIAKLRDFIAQRGAIAQGTDALILAVAGAAGEQAVTLVQGIDVIVTVIAPQALRAHIIVVFTVSTTRHQSNPGQQCCGQR
ncbi:hypothetical protein D3C81_799800 [compost metagenome]